MLFVTIFHYCMWYRIRIYAVLYISKLVPVYIMGSTELITYLNYIANWELESDGNIDSVISELTAFLKLDHFESDSVVDDEFETLSDLACDVRDHTIAADATQIAADAAAVASIYSFGLGMAAFAILEASAAAERAMISNKSKELNVKLGTVDVDISSKINSDVKAYVEKYKANNNLINAQAPKGMVTRTCRVYLMQFMAQVQKRHGSITASVFRQYAASARLVFDSKEIEAVYDAFDELNMSARNDSDVKKFMDALAGLQLPEYAKEGKALVQGLSLAIMYHRLAIANKTIEECARAAGIPLEEVESSAFGMMDAVGKFATAVAVAMSVVDVILNILDIVDVVEQCRKMCDELNGKIKESYKAFFNGIRQACTKYKEACGPDIGLGGIMQGNTNIRAFSDDLV